jgi:hypothetical protein
MGYLLTPGNDTAFDETKASCAAWLACNPSAVYPAFQIPELRADSI